jgi:hypothetical protein
MPSGELELTIGLATRDTSKHNSINFFNIFFHVFMCLLSIILLERPEAMITGFVLQQKKLFDLIIDECLLFY